MPRLPVSAVVPTLNEEAALPACLESLAWADEVIVVDSGSTDSTAALAEKTGARVVLRPFTTYGDQRNHGASLARNDWVLCVDADERVSPELAGEIESRLGAGPDRCGYRIPRITTFAGAVIRHCGWQRDRVLCLYDRRRGAWDPRLVHERVRLEGEAGDLGAPLHHHTYRDLGSYADKSRRYAELGARELHQAGRRSGPAALLLLPAARFLKMYVLNRGFLDGMPGLVLCVIAAYGVFVKYARLWELDRSRIDARVAKGESTWQ